MKKLLAGLVALVVVGAFVGTLVFLKKKSETKPVVWQVETPKVATIVKKTVATGSVGPRKEVAIKPQVSGIVDTLYVEAGQVVAAGDLVARIQIIPNMVTLNSAESRAKQARIQMLDGRRELERQRQLRREGAVAETSLQQAEVAFASAEEELAAALDHLELIRKGTTRKSQTTSNTLVRATIAGMVLEVPVEQGDSVIETNTFNDGTTIATIADMTELVFEGKVDESEVGKIRPGMELLLTIGALADESFKAKLEHIAPKGVEENGAIQFAIRAALVVSEGTLIRANLSANADIVLDRRDEVLAIDEALLQFDDGKPYVEVETAPQTFERRAVETGLSDGITIEILSGLSKTDRVKNAAKEPVG